MTMRRRDALRALGALPLLAASCERPKVTFPIGGFWTRRSVQLT
jgi:hypothetical protein